MNKVQRADLDGNNVEDLVTTGLDNPYAIALGADPPGPIPTMGEWSFLLFGLSLFTVAVVGLYNVQRKGGGAKEEKL